MNIQILKISNEELVFEIDEGHTICNLLCKRLLENPMVKFAGYNIKHPLTPTSIITIQTKDINPINALEETISKIYSELNEIKSVLYEVSRSENEKTN
ncbi:MAG: RpoL/Rpb11 RNA polymerase subunit family protein [Candidatus Methanomethylicia archaeon]